LAEQAKTDIVSTTIQAEITRYPYLSKWLRVLVVTVSTIAVSIAIVYLFGFHIGGWVLLDIGYYYLIFAVFGACIFLLLPASKKQLKKVPWYDYLFAVMFFSFNIYYSFHAYDIRLVGWVPPPSTPIFLSAFIIVALVLEGARRMGGIFFLIVLVLIGAYPLYASHMPSFFWGKDFDFTSIICLFVFSPSGLVGLPGQVLGDILIGFLVFAAFVISSGAGTFFLDLAVALCGKYRGGPAKVSVVASGFFGMLSGSAVANVAGTGSFTIPTMKRMGYPPHYAGAIEACA
jgi:TRAP-type uncharacterized transport system fused permease subunit